MFVCWKVRWDPVQDHSDAILMQAVNEVHEILRRAVATRRSKVTSSLITPRTIEGVFRNGQKLHMRKTRLSDVFSQSTRHFAIGKRAVPLFGNTLPGTKMDLVDGEWGI